MDGGYNLVPNSLQRGPLQLLAFEPSCCGRSPTGVGCTDAHVNVNIQHLSSSATSDILSNNNFRQRHLLLNDPVNHLTSSTNVSVQSRLLSLGFHLLTSRQYHAE